ncbi:MAG: CBS domain-containing protein [Deltaproteobacteria bacterium]|nr:CBS domain-containing protein [Deltaproteobacteria bacterium]MBW2398555.1 CBS domain-containing protein [Deltaproteobacteria bacterium]
MALTASDIMQTQVVTVSPSDPLHSVQRLFYEEEIHGAPVVDETSRVRGMISSMDLIRAVMEENDSSTGVDFTDAFEQLGGPWEAASQEFQDRLGESAVADVMTESIVSVDPTASIPEVASLLRQNRIHRVLVVKGDNLLGIISSFDLIQLLEEAD